MTKKRHEKNYEMKGFGFRVVLSEVELVPHGDDFYPKVNARKLQDAVFDSLLKSRMQLHGAHLAFIRKYMDLTQTEFGELVGLNGHATVSGWESAGTSVPKGLDSPYLAIIRAVMAEYRGKQELRLSEFTSAVRTKLPLPEAIVAIECPA